MTSGLPKPSPTCSILEITAPDGVVADGVFAYVAKLWPNLQNSSFKPGCLVAFRGSVENGVNSKRDQMGTLVSGVTNCTGCTVHLGYKEAWDSVKFNVWQGLQTLGCTPTSEEMVIHMTGHGSGAAVATLAMWELAQVGYRFAPAHLFGSPRVGNKVFTKALHSYFDRQGVALYSIANEPDGLPLSPDDGGYARHGHQVFYPSVDSKIHQVCIPEDQECSDTVVGNGNRSKDVCQSALAPAKSFCRFTDFALQCYGGLSTDFLLANYEGRVAT